MCLTVYWFDPPVWAAAAVSRTDCELACDEGALRQLGEGGSASPTAGRRWRYPGAVPAGKSPLSATTMASGKRALRDRITRIAASRQTRFAALFAVAAPGGGGVRRHLHRRNGRIKVRPLTGEAGVFNEEFFNGEITTSITSSSPPCTSGRRTSTSSSSFYCGVGEETVSNAELRQLSVLDENGEKICDTDKLPPSPAMDDVLLQNTGLTLEETSGIGLQGFQYLPEQEAYHHTHGDTNYRMQVTFSSGGAGGGTIRLYYDDTFMRTGPSATTLTVRPDGGYWFVSNLRLPPGPPMHRTPSST